MDFSVRLGGSLLMTLGLVLLACPARVGSVRSHQRLRAEIETRPCLNDCSSQLDGDRGTCVDGTCRCADAFAGVDCSVALIPNEGIEEMDVSADDSVERRAEATCKNDICATVRWSPLSSDSFARSRVLSRPPADVRVRRPVRVEEYV